MKFLPLCGSLLILFTTIAGAATFVVTNTANTGPGSFRQAILSANTTPGANVINFNIPGSGVQTISLTNQLPDITNVVFINGFSQPGSSANTLTNGDNSVHLIRLDGLYVTNTSPVGLNFPAPNPFVPSPASGSTVRGLIIVRFYYAIKMAEASNMTIAGNWIGMDVGGIAHGTTQPGIEIDASFNPSTGHVIGGLTPADRNVISGNRYGIYFNGTIGNSVVQGNFIGTDPTGTLPRGNLFGGVYIFSGTNITVGGTSEAARNIISASTFAGGCGVGIQSGKNFVLGNYIGTDVSGQYDLGNVSDGVYVFAANSNRIAGNVIANNRRNGINLDTANGNVIENNYIGSDISGTRSLGNALAGIAITGGTNRIGGLANGQGNVIYNNGGGGVEIGTAAIVPQRNEIAGNSIYNNGGLAVDLYPLNPAFSTGINTNDFQDADTGVNGMQNFPVLTNAVISSGLLAVRGNFNSKPAGLYRIELFATPSWDALNIPEGKIFLGSTNVTTDAAGNANFTANLGSAPDPAYLITATATDSSGNTSEFSAGIPMTASAVTSPLLTLSRSGGGNGVFSLSWSAAGFTLERTASLTPPISWTAITTGITSLNGTNFLLVTNNASPALQFFRLRSP